MQHLPAFLNISFPTTDTNANLNYLWRTERVRGPGAQLSWNKNGGTYSFDRIFNGMGSGEEVGVADRMILRAPTYMMLWLSISSLEYTDWTDVIYRSRRLRGDTVRNSAFRPQKQGKCAGNLRYDARTITTGNSGHGEAQWKHFLQEAVWEHSGLIALASKVHCTRQNSSVLRNYFHRRRAESRTVSVHKPSAMQER